jgi:hypothetical protein
MERRSEALMTVGGVFVVGGLIAGIAGIDIAGGCGVDCSADQKNLGLDLAVGGCVGIVLGIPLFFIGAHKVRVTTTATAAASAGTGLPAWVGEPAGHGWRWQF